MRRSLLPLLACTAALASPSTASAVNVAVGPEGRAFMTWTNDLGLRFSERTPDDSFTAHTTIAPPKTYPAFVSAGPGGSAIVLAYDETGTAPRGILLVSRPAGARAFLVPVPFAPAVRVVGAASNARGDGAVLLKPFPGNLVLRTRVAGGPFGPPQEVPSASETASVAVNRDGRVLVAYYDFGGAKGIRAQLGAVDSPLGPVKRLSSTTSFSDVGAALDDQGNATVAYARTDERHRERGAELVVRRARSDGRFGASAVVARGGPPIMGAGFASFRIAAAGSTTALAFDPNGEDGRLGVAIARGSARFGAVQRPTAPNIREFVRQPFYPGVAVDRAGDVLLTYNTGFTGNAVYATERRAGGKRFASPRVISSLGYGGAPVPALLSDRTRLIAWDYDGALFYATRFAGGRRPDYSPPRAGVMLLRGTETRLRASNTAGVRVRCSETCLVTGRATLRTSTGRTIQGAGRKILNAGVKYIKRFEFDPSKRAGRARGGSILRVTINVENASGASREIVTQITLDRR